jgi:hypothetical protein
MSPIIKTDKNDCTKVAPALSNLSDQELFNFFPLVVSTSDDEAFSYQPLIVLIKFSAHSIAHTEHSVTR